MWRYLGITAGLILVLVFGAVSLWLAWPWVLSENMRLTRVELVLTWLAEAGALLWFVYFLIKFMITSETDSALDEDIAHAPGKQLLALIVVLFAAVDLGATFYFEAQSKALRRTAVEGACRIDEIKVYEMKPLLDSQRNQVGVAFCVLARCTLLGGEKEVPTLYYGKNARFPDSVHDAIVRDHLPAEMPITYVEKFPRKFWIAGVEDDYMSVWRLSQEITIFALVFTLLVLATNKVLFATPIPLEICPLLGVVLRIGIAGWYMFFHDQTTIPPL